MLNREQLEAITKCNEKECIKCELFDMNKQMICADHIEIARTAIEALDKAVMVENKNLKIIEAVGFCLLCKHKNTSTSVDPCRACKCTKYKFELAEKLR